MAIVILDNYDSFTYNLFQLTQGLTDEPVQVYRNDALDFETLQSLRPSRVILSPGPGHPARPEDFGLCREVIERHVELACPVLGVCLGHQGIVHYLGGSIGKAPAIIHGKTSMITVTQPTRLFEGLPNPFKAMRYHSLVAYDENFPEVLEVIARESQHGLTMAVQHKTLPIFGVQFHPESIGTPEGLQMMRNFIEKC